MKLLLPLLILAVAVAASGCISESDLSELATANNTTASSQPEEIHREVLTTDYDEITRYVIESDGVVCYYRDEYGDGGMACLPINQTSIDAGDTR